MNVPGPGGTENRALEAAGRRRKWLGGCEMCKVRPLCGKEPSSG